MVRTIRTGMNRYRTARAPNILASGGLGPCIAVGAIAGNKGYMMHYIPLQNIDRVDCVVRFFKGLEKDVSDKSKVKLYLAGGAAFKDDTEAEEIFDSLIEGRENILRKLRDNGYPLPEVRFNEGRGQEIVLFLSEGRGEIQEF